LDICNPNYAKKILDYSMELSMLLPCKISVYEDNEECQISMLKISSLLPLLEEELKPLALEIEETLLKIIDLSK